MLAVIFHSTFGLPKMRSEDQVMSAVGLCEKLGDEKLLDAVTGLSGSGPAYVSRGAKRSCTAGQKNTTFVWKKYENTWAQHMSWLNGFE